jgi:putative (di)nucleoside polyphosphate hydrolase
VYEMALTELARYLPRINHHNRYLRAGMRPAHRERNSGPMPLEAPLETISSPPDGEPPG